MADIELDVREIPKPQRHSTIFTAFDGLPVGAALILTNDHYPQHLQDEFEATRAGAYDWRPLVRDHQDYRIRIGKTAEAEPAAPDGPPADNPAAAPDSAQQLLADD
ncbi:DUF2249 domain-containing protein [Gordonia sp. VNK21]|uniref:DUF2249 domain-containing protein n=1 Tax=Gordonia sp. VNK21 TaxID=3382483 RepID=UPI0038D3C568